MKKQELREKLEQGHAEFASYVQSLNEADLCFALPGKWSAGQQLQHIVLSLAALNRAMHNPKYVAAITEMEPQRELMDFDAFVGLYNRVIRKGTEAPASFVPGPVTTDDRDLLPVAIHNAVVELCGHMDAYSEAQLDELTLPHPKIGRLTVREMLYFTIQHCRHHYSLAMENTVRP